MIEDLEQVKETLYTRGGDTESIEAVSSQLDALPTSALPKYVLLPIAIRLILLSVPKNKHVKGFLGSILTPTRVLGSFPPASAAEGIKSVPSLCLSVSPLADQNRPREPLIRLNVTCEFLITMSQKS